MRLTKAIQKLDYISASDCYGLFKVLIEWVLNPDESEVWRPAFKNLQILAEAQPKVYTQFIRPNLIIEIALNYPNSDADTYEKIAPGICEWLCILQWKVEVATYRCGNIGCGVSNSRIQN